MKENRNSSKHVETEASSLLLLILASVRNDTNEFHLGGVSGGEQVLDFHMRKRAPFKVLILQNTSSDKPGSRIMLAKSAVGTMKSWETEGCGMNPPGTIVPWQDEYRGVIALWSNPSGATMRCRPASGGGGLAWPVVAGEPEQWENGLFQLLSQLFQPTPNSTPLQLA